MEEKKVTLIVSGQGGLAEWMGLEAFTWMDMHEWRVGSIDVMDVARRLISHCVTWLLSRYYPSYLFDRHLAKMVQGMYARL